MSLMSRVTVSDNVWGSWEQGRMFVCLIEYIRLLTRYGTAEQYEKMKTRLCGAFLSTERGDGWCFVEAEDKAWIERGIRPFYNDSSMID